MEEFDPDRGEVLRRAFDAGIRFLLCPIDISSERSRRISLNLAAEGISIQSAAGLHPHQAKLLSPDLIAVLEKLAAEGKIRAIGEIGLDFHYDFSSPDEQRAAFREQLALAQRLDLPAIIHSRNAGGEIARAVEEAGFSNGGVLHCFTEDWDFARTMLDAGFFISFSGIVTFPNAGNLREIAKKVPADRLLVETDAPYLAPLPHRGRRNEPAYVVETAALIAGSRNMPLDQFADTITQNFRTLFKI